MISKCGMPPPARDSLIIVCGTDSFEKHVNSLLEPMGYENG